MGVRLRRKRSEGAGAGEQKHQTIMLVQHLRTKRGEEEAWDRKSLRLRGSEKDLVSSRQATGEALAKTTSRRNPVGRNNLSLLSLHAPSLPKSSLEGSGGPWPWLNAMVDQQVQQSEAAGALKPTRAWL